MKDAIKSTCIVDGLLEPYDILVFTASAVLVSGGIFLGNFFFINF
jgi:hypothetical protein